MNTQGTDFKFAMKTLDKYEMQERNKVSTGGGWCSAVQGAAAGVCGMGRMLTAAR